jgi:HlyD family secretion protein
MPRMRHASENVATGADRTIWVLENGRAREVAVKTGASDGRRTEITEGDLQPGKAAIVDVAASRG